jgi:diguanylate cyclase (GGDEF)-like protein
VENLRVLIIDDDKDVAGFFSTVLGLLGHDCEIVLTAKEALTRLASSLPDLILLDMRLGTEIGGDDILYQIRSNPRFDNTRVVVITAYPMVAEMVNNLADLILIKPVEVEQLKTLISRMENYQAGPRRSPFRDPITQLFSRDYFITRLELAFDRLHRRPDFLFAVVIIDVKLEGQDENDLETDVWAHILREISDKLHCHLRPMDAIAKFAGWRFATLHEELKEPEDVEAIRARICASLDEPINFNGSVYRVKIHSGAAAYGQQFKLPVEILKAAEKDAEIDR